MNTPENTAFGHDGQLEPTVDFDYGDDGDDHHDAHDHASADRRDTVARLLCYLGVLSVTQAGRRVVLLHHLLYPVESQRQLAKRLGVSPAAVSMALKRLRAEMGRLI